jgi:hypothetical protein
MLPLLTTLLLLGLCKCTCAVQVSACVEIAEGGYYELTKTLFSADFAQVLFVLVFCSFAYCVPPSLTYPSASAHAFCECSRSTIH